MLYADLKQNDIIGIRDDLGDFMWVQLGWDGPDDDGEWRVYVLDREDHNGYEMWIASHVKFVHFSEYLDGVDECT